MHSQSFETGKMKGRNIIQDFIVLHLALLSIDKIICVDKMGQTPKETNKLDKNIFHKIEKSMKSFDWNTCNIGRILSHLIVSLKRCVHIYKTHSQSVDTSKMKGRNIIQDLVVLHLALISIDKMICVDKMGQTPKETHKLDKKTFHEIKKSRKSFD